MDSKTVSTGVCILAGNMKKEVEFYRDVLGLEVDWDGENFAEIKTSGGYLAFFMYSREMFVKAFDGWKYQPPEGINQTYEIGIWLPKFADVDAEYAKLKTAGADLVSGEPVTFPWGMRNFYVADPEGNLLEIGSYNAE